MRHNNSGRRLGRTTSHRTAMFRNMVTSFFSHERITTTDAKAKELRPIAEKMITLGKRGDLHAIRQASSFIREKSVVTKLFSTIAPRYKERQGGYTRIIKLGIRPGDNASMSIIELVEEELSSKVKKSKPKKQTLKAAAPAKKAEKVEAVEQVEAKEETVEEAEKAEIAEEATVSVDEKADITK